MKVLLFIKYNRKIKNRDLRYSHPIKIISSNQYGKIDLSDELFRLAISNDGHYISTEGTFHIIKTYDLTNNLGYVIFLQFFPKYTNSF